MKKRDGVKLTGLLFRTLFILFMSFPDLCLGQSLEEAARLNKEVVKLYKQGRYQEAIPTLLDLENIIFLGISDYEEN